MTNKAEQASKAADEARILLLKIRRLVDLVEALDPEEVRKFHVVNMERLVSDLRKIEYYAGYAK